MSTPMHAPIRIVLHVGAPASRWTWAFALLTSPAVFSFVSFMMSSSPKLKKPADTAATRVASRRFVENEGAGYLPRVALPKFSWILPATCWTLPLIC